MLSLSFLIISSLYIFFFIRLYYFFIFEHLVTNLPLHYTIFFFTFRSVCIFFTSSQSSISSGANNQTWSDSQPFSRLHSSLAVPYIVSQFWFHCKIFLSIFLSFPFSQSSFSSITEPIRLPTLHLSSLFIFISLFRVYLLFHYSIRFCVSSPLVSLPSLQLSITKLFRLATLQFSPLVVFISLFRVPTPISLYSSILPFFPSSKSSFSSDVKY